MDARANMDALRDRDGDADPGEEHPHTDAGRSDKHAHRHVHTGRPHPDARRANVNATPRVGRHAWFRNIDAWHARGYHNVAGPGHEPAARWHAGARPNGDRGRHRPA